MASTIKCYKCKQNVQKYCFLTRNTCERSYDLHCANVTTKRYDLMRSDPENDRRLTWNCVLCIKKSINRQCGTRSTYKIKETKQKGPKTSTPGPSNPERSKNTNCLTTMHQQQGASSSKEQDTLRKTKNISQTGTVPENLIETDTSSACLRDEDKSADSITQETNSPKSEISPTEHITFRKAIKVNIPQYNSFETLAVEDDFEEKEEEEKPQEGRLNRSCPEIGKYAFVIEELEEKEKKLLELENKLKITAKINDEYMYENEELKKRIEQLETKIATLTRICSGTPNNVKGTSVMFDKSNVNQFRRDSHSQHSFTLLEPTPTKSKSKDSEHIYTHLVTISSKISNLQKQLIETLKELKALTGIPEMFDQHSETCLEEQVSVLVLANELHDVDKSYLQQSGSTHKETGLGNETHEKSFLQRSGSAQKNEEMKNRICVVTKRSFPRRPKPTVAPAPELSSINPEVDTATSKYTRRANFKSRTTTEAPTNSTNAPDTSVSERSEVGKSENGGKRTRRPSLNGSGARNERPARNFVRRRVGGANATSTTEPSSSSSPVPPSSTRRPFRVASRRRPLSSTLPSSPPSTTTTTTTTTEAPTTTTMIEEDSMQDIGDTDFIEDPTPEDRPSPTFTKTRRPLLLKEDDQNPSATNEEERKRHSKKYSSSFKQNQLDEVLRKREKERSKEEVDLTTEGVKTTVDDNDAETAIAIATHQLLSAPLPSVPNYDDEPKTPKRPYKPPTTIHEYEYTSPTYIDEYTKNIQDSSTPYINEYSTTGSVYDFNSIRTTSATNTPKSSTYPTLFPSRVSRPAAFTTANILSTQRTEFEVEHPTVNSFRSTEARGFSRPSTLSSGFNNLPSSLSPSTSRYVGSTDKLIPVPVEDYGFTTGGYSTLHQEPAYFTREYLLESPVTKTYDDEYQYLSPTTPQSTTRKINKKITYRKISTTIPPTMPPYVPEVTPLTPRRVPNRKLFEKVPSKEKTKYKPIENYDYYDEGGEMASKYDEGTKVVLHSKGTIECLDIGNFPHPGSCKKFISCARLENGSLLGWEYICPKGLSFDPVGGICNWSAGLGCHENK